MQIGQHVLCARNISHRRSSEDRGEVAPLKGVVYTVRDVMTVNNTLLIRVREVRNRKLRYLVEGKSTLIECAFPAQYFKPLQKLRVEDFISTTAPRETELA